MAAVVATDIIGVFMIFPFFFWSCSWWKKIVYPAYEVSVSSYKCLQRLTKSKKINKLTLNVIDNTFNDQKAKILYNILSKSSIKRFVFTNRAMNYDYNDTEWSDFDKNMEPIKNLLMSTSMKWGTSLT